MNIFGKRSDLPFSRKSDRKKDKSVLSFTHEQNIICGQTLEAKHSWTTLPMSRPLFVGSYKGSYLQVTWWTFSANEKEEQFALNDNEVYCDSELL